MRDEGSLTRSSLLSRESLHDLIAAVDAYGTRHALSTGDIFAVKLALDELGTNLLTHGALPGVQPELQLRLRHDTRQLELVIRDNGRPFDAATAPDRGAIKPDDGILPVGGLGLTLLRGFVRRLEYSYEDGWNELSLEYDRERKSGTPA